MPTREIILYPNKVLRTPAAAVESISPEIVELIEDMTETMYEAPGIGLAAPQVGVSLRVVVIDIGEEENSLLQLINPEIIERGEIVPSEEGCLSIPSIRETVRRHANVRVKALNPQGESFEVEAEGLLSFCLQHEIDHLDGVLFIDHLSKLKRTLLQKKLKKLSAKE